jgi:hypothetical protein
LGSSILSLADFEGLLGSLDAIAAKPQTSVFPSKKTQKPSSANPTQLTTTTDEATAAKVMMVLMDRTIWPSLQAMRKICRMDLRNQGDCSSRLILNLTVAALPQTDRRRPQKIHICAT